MAKIRSYKVQADVFGVPYIPIKGKFLTKDFNLQAGDYVEVIPVNGTIVFRELSTAEISLKQTTRLRTTFKRLFDTCEKHLLKHEHKYIKYFDHERFINNLKECGQIMLTMQVLAIDEAIKNNVLKIINRYKSQLATCEQSFYEIPKSILINIELDSYHRLIELLRHFGQRLGIVSRRKVLPFKKKKQAQYLKPTYPQYGGLMVAESKGEPYSVEDERLRIDRAELSELARLVCENNTTQGAEA